MSAMKLSFFLIGSEIGEIPAGTQHLIYTVSYLESLLIAVLRQWAMVLKNLIKASYAKDHFVSTHQAEHKTKVGDKYSWAKSAQRISTSMAD